MTEPLFEMLGYELPIIAREDGHDGREIDDPAYMFPGNRPKPKGDRRQKIKGRYIEEKKINGRLYLYERWRENGRLKSKYLGSKDKILSR